MPKANGYIKSLTKLDTGHKRQFELIAVMRGVPMYVIIKEAMADFVENMNVKMATLAISKRKDKNGYRQMAEGILG